jgi:hypothetical protein
MIKFQQLVGAGILACAASGAFALNIDDFNSGSLEFPGIFALGPAGSSSGQQAGSMVGGTRDIGIQMLQGSGTSIVTVPSASGLLDINNGATERSTVTVLWNANGVGLGGLDLTDAGLSLGLFMALPNPIDNIMDTLWTITSASGSSTRARQFPDGSQGADFFFPFANFTGTADFAAVTAIQLEITSPSVGLDTQIDLVETRPRPPTVPVPGTLLLMGLGLAGIAARRVKRS